jgi:hypothetical protein
MVIFGHLFHLIPKLTKLVWTVIEVAASILPSGFLLALIYDRIPPLVVIHFRNCEVPSTLDRFFTPLLRALTLLLVARSETHIELVDIDVVKGKLDRSSKDFEEFQKRQVELVQSLAELSTRVAFFSGKGYCRKYGDVQYFFETCSTQYAPGAHIHEAEL